MASPESNNEDQHGSCDGDHSGHSHHHHHHGEDDDLAEQDDDAGQRSLSDALKVSFSVLRWIMIALTAAFLFSGWFNVKEGMVAVRLRFGAIRGEKGQQVLGPGGPYFALPEPVDSVLFVPVGEQQTSLDDAFWFKQNKEDELASLDDLKPGKDGLQPGRDGYLLTGDQNIVHAHWTINFRIRADEAILFIKNVGTSHTAKSLQDAAKELVQHAAEKGILYATAQSTVDEFVRADINKAVALRKTQDVLDRLGAGIQVTGILVNQPTAPLAVRPSFNKVNQAQSYKAQELEKAHREQSKILNEVAGTAHTTLLQTIEEYEVVRSQGDKKSIVAVESKLNALLTGPSVGGAVAVMLNEARTKRTADVERIRTEVETFKRLLPQYEKSPEFMRRILWQEALVRIYAGDVEKYFIPKGTIVLELERDPELKQEKEMKKYKAEVKGKK